MTCDPPIENVVVVPVGTPIIECPKNPETFGDLLSTFANEQVPEHVRQNHQKFVQFLEAHGEFMELPANPVGRITCFPNYIDVDRTTDEFFYLFKQTFLAPFPETFLADRSLVTKKIKDFYATKGTEESLRMLFRILYGEEIDIFLPKLHILKASDGKWQQDTRLFVVQGIGDPFEFAQKAITGVTSGATAEVDYVEVETIGVFTVYSLILLNFSGTFLSEEDIFVDTCPTQLVVNTLGFISGIDITNGGDGYAVGDSITITHPSGINATAEVCEVDASNPVVSFIINNGGDGYRVGDPVDFAPNAGDGFGAVANVSSITITSSISQSQKLILEEQNTTVSSVASIVIQDFLNFQIVDRGIITGILIQEGGKFYPDTAFSVDIGFQAPAICFDWPAGTGADIGAVTGNTGAVLKACVSNHGIGYTAPTTSGFLTGDGLATGDVVVTGGPLVDSGKYLNTDGFLSWDMILQDNHFWQNYSYEITSEHSINEWRDTVKNTTHPAGYALFGNLSILNEIKNPLRLNVTAIDKCIVVETNVSGTVIDQIEDVAVLYWGGFVPCQDFFPFTPIIAEYQTQLLSDWANVPIIDLVQTDSDPCYQQNLAIYDIV